MKALIQILVVLAALIAFCHPEANAKAKQIPSKIRIKPPVQPVAPKPIKVMVIDTGVSPHLLIKSYLPKGWEQFPVDYPTNRPEVTADIAIHHGTNIAGIILFGNQDKPDAVACENVVVYSCSFYDKSNTDEENVQKTANCLRRAIILNVDFVNYSAGGPGGNPIEEKLISILSANGTKIVVAAGNDAKPWDKTSYFPAQYTLKNYSLENLIPVGNIDYEGHRAVTSNYTGGIVYDYGTNIRSTVGMKSFDFMSGTSQAAAMYTHRLVLKRCMQIQSETEANKHLAGP